MSAVNTNSKIKGEMELVYVSRRSIGGIDHWVASSVDRYNIFTDTVRSSDDLSGWWWVAFNGSLWERARRPDENELPCLHWISLLPIDVPQSYGFGRSEGHDVFIPSNIMAALGDQSRAQMRLVQGEQDRLQAVELVIQKNSQIIAKNIPRPYDPLIDEPSLAGQPKRTPPAEGNHPHRGRLRAQGRTQGGLNIHLSLQSFLGKQHTTLSKRVFMTPNGLESMTHGEQAVLRALDAHLPGGWEIYPQPHLGVRQPDFIIFHPDGAFVVIEVKDWNLASYRWVGDSVQVTNGNGWYNAGLDPITQAKRVRERLFTECFPDLQESRLLAPKTWIGITRAWAVIPTESQFDVDSFYGEASLNLRNVQYELVFGGDTIALSNWIKYLPTPAKDKNLVWSEEITVRVRAFLRPSMFQIEQGTTFGFEDLSRANKRYAKSKRGHFRIEGAAGTGKSSILAIRAVEIARSGRRVLMVGFNITMSHWHRDIVQRSPVEFDRSLIDFQYFYGIIKDIAELQTPLDADDSWWEKTAPTQALETLRGRSDAPAYDAILVDEVQDFHLSWFRVLEELLTENGELVVMADQAQNIYKREQRWLFAPQSVPGIAAVPFRGRWPHLREGHRVPNIIVSELLHPYLQRFPSSADLEPDEGPRVENAFYHWEDSMIEAAKIRIVEVIQSVLVGQPPANVTKWPKPVQRGDVVILVETHKTGIDIADRLDAKGSISMVARLFPTTKEIDKEAKNTPDIPRDDIVERLVRSRKTAFRAGDGRIKLCTVHSFKGWSAQWPCPHSIDNRWKETGCG